MAEEMDVRKILDRARTVRVCDAKGRIWQIGGMLPNEALGEAAKIVGLFRVIDEDERMILEVYSLPEGGEMKAANIGLRSTVNEASGHISTEVMLMDLWKQTFEETAMVGDDEDEAPAVVPASIIAPPATNGAPVATVTPTPS